MSAKRVGRPRRKRKLSPEKMLETKRHRADLAALSRAIKAGMAMGQFPECGRVNEALLEIYRNETGQHDFRRFREWKGDGYSVRKGEKAFRVWAKPRKASKAEVVETPAGKEETKDEFDWFPICCLFHAGQVEDAEGNGPPSCPLFVLRRFPLALPAPGGSHHRSEVAA